MLAGRRHDAAKIQEAKLVESLVLAHFEATACRHLVELMRKYKEGDTQVTAANTL